MISIEIIDLLVSYQTFFHLSEKKANPTDTTFNKAKFYFSNDYD